MRDLESGTQSINHSPLGQHCDPRPDCTPPQPVSTASQGVTADTKRVQTADPGRIHREAGTLPWGVGGGGGGGKRGGRVDLVFIVIRILKKHFIILIMHNAFIHTDLGKVP